MVGYRSEISINGLPMLPSSVAGASAVNECNDVLLVRGKEGLDGGRKLLADLYDSTGNDVCLCLNEFLLAEIPDQRTSKQSQFSHETRRNGDKSLHVD